MRKSTTMNRDKIIHFEFNMISAAYAVSGAFLMLLIASGNIYCFAAFLVLGLAAGYIEGMFAKKTDKDKFADVIGIAIAVGILILSCKHFLKVWEFSSKIQRISGIIDQDKEIVLIALSIIISICAFPSLFFVTRLIVKLVAEYFRIIFKVCSLKDIMCDLKMSASAITFIFINIILAVIIGVVLLVAAYSLPTNNIEKNVKESAKIIFNEGAYPQLFSWCNSYLDNYTDSIMLLEAADNTDADPVEKAVMAYRGEILSEEPWMVLTKHYILGEEYTSACGYSRYWHGYQIVLKPLLEFMDYGGIRILNTIFQVLLTGIIGLLLYKHGKFYYFPAYIIAYLMLMPVAIGKSLQFSSCYYALTLGTIALLMLSDSDRRKYAFVVFLNIGIFTAYYDFLTYPMATFGVPAVIYIALENSDDLNKKVADLIKNGINWCIGYGGMWISKWVITYLLTGYDAFSEASAVFTKRISDTGSAGENYSRLSCIQQNYSAFLSTPIKIIYVIAVLYLIVKIYNRKTVSKETRVSISLPYLLLAITPVVWYAFALNHSVNHYWFTNKACIVTFLAFLFCLVNMYYSYADANHTE